MGDSPQASDSLSSIALDAQELGKDIASLLEASSFTQEEKESWAVLIPFMNPEELERFVRILEKNVETQVVEKTEDTVLLLKAAQMKYDFAVAHAEHEAEKVIRDIEKKLEEVE